jgi:hypothetical protein
LPRLISKIYCLLGSVKSTAIFILRTMSLRSNITKMVLEQFIEKKASEKHKDLEEEKKGMRRLRTLLLPNMLVQARPKKV